MPLRLRELFARQQIDRGASISVRNNLYNHQLGPVVSVRDIANRFLTPTDGDGYGRGCHQPSQLFIGDFAYAVPSWVSVDDVETRTVEGILTRSKITHEDFPLQPWHTYYDWNFFVRLDRQYTYLHSTSNVLDHGNVMECEWDTGFLPDWAWPMEDDRIWLRGRWIYDCGHPENNGHKTEIHPPKALASFRSEAKRLPGNEELVPATMATVYLGRRGGYWTQDINDEDYEFDIQLPSRPYAEAEPRWMITSKTGQLVVAPIVEQFPLRDPDKLRVRIPLKGATPPPSEYGFLIWAGWSDPRRTQSRFVWKKRVEVTSLIMDGDYDVFDDEWYVYIGINGRWHVLESIGGSSESVSFNVELDLAYSDKIQIEVCGFEADLIHDYMGKRSGYRWDQIADPSLSQSEREEIESDVFGQLFGSLKDKNDVIGHLKAVHRTDANGQFVTQSDRRDYRLQYAISTVF